MKNVINLKTASLEKAADIIHSFESALIDGKITSFYIVGITENDEVTVFSGAVKPITRLRMGGALQHALHMFNHDEDINY